MRSPLLSLSTLALGLFLLAGEAQAVVGRPLTPVSVAGVARRTTRRVAYTGAAVAASNTAAYNAAAYSAAAATPVTTLPSGCVQVVNAGVAYQQCGSTYYRPYYEAGNLVYVPATP
jgi:hypothetical protein